MSICVKNRKNNLHSRYLIRFVSFKKISYRFISKYSVCRIPFLSSVTQHRIIDLCKVNDKTGSDDAVWMRRCFDLARRGIGFVSPNPPVGAVLVYDGRILGEGFHARYGGPHAEVNAVRNVSLKDRHLIPASTLYVSLEPCCITGKTPPCTDLIITEGIKDVRVSTTDPNPCVAGKGIDRLRTQGVEVTVGILEEEGKSLIRPFTTNILRHRPHVILKWAQSKFGYTGMDGQQVWLSDPLTRTWSHGQRAEADAILIGARSITTDNPSLTVRDYPGRSPHRVVLDPNGRLEVTHHVFHADGCRVFYFSGRENQLITGEHITKVVYPNIESSLSFILQFLFDHQVGILLIEGGSYTHRLFIKANLWDEAWVIQSRHELNSGIVAPNVRGRLITKLRSGRDLVIGIANDQV